MPLEQSTGCKTNKNKVTGCSIDEHKAAKTSSIGSAHVMLVKCFCCEVTEHHVVFAERKLCINPDEVVGEAVGFCYACFQSDHGIVVSG